MKNKERTIALIGTMEQCKRYAIKNKEDGTTFIFMNNPSHARGMRFDAYAVIDYIPHCNMIVQIIKAHNSEATDVHARTGKMADTIIIDDAIKIKKEG
jgi:hypothetical protein